MSPVPDQITDHAEQAQDDVISPLRKDRILALVEIIADQLQLLEDWYYAIMTGRLLGSAVGAQLDLLGRVVGGIARSRLGLGDDAFEVLIGVAVRINRCRGMTDDVLEIVAALVGAAVRYIQLQPATAWMQWKVATASDPDWLDVVVAQFPRIVPSGVSWIAVEGETPVFQFDVGPGFDVGQLANVVSHE